MKPNIQRRHGAGLGVRALHADISRRFRVNRRSSDLLLSYAQAERLSELLVQKRQEAEKARRKHSRRRRSLLQ